jgi:hypothetical protein
LIASLFFLGRLHELSEIVPPLLAEFEGSGNLYATAAFRTAYSTAAWLTRDQVDEADRQLALARDESKSTAYQLVHSNLLFGDTFRDLYLGDAGSAHGRMTEHWPQLARAMLLRVSTVRSQCWQLRGSSAVQAAHEAGRAGQLARAGELRRDARRAIKALSADALTRSRPLAMLIGAALAWTENEPERARDGLIASIAALDAQGLRAYASAARVRLGEISGSEALIVRGRGELVAEHAKCPDRLVAWLAPGFLQ